jgi:hypothetical protein
MFHRGSIIVLHATQGMNRTQHIFYENVFHCVFRVAAEFKAQIKKPATAIGRANIRNSRTHRTPAMWRGRTVDGYGGHPENCSEVHVARIYAHQQLSVRKDASDLTQAVTANKHFCGSSLGSQQLAQCVAAVFIRGRTRQKENPPWNHQSLRQMSPGLNRPLPLPTLRPGGPGMKDHNPPAFQYRLRKRASRDRKPRLMM